MVDKFTETATLSEASHAQAVQMTGGHGRTAYVLVVPWSITWSRKHSSLLVTSQLSSCHSTMHHSGVFGDAAVPTPTTPPVL